MGLSAPIVGTPTLVNTGAASGTVVVPATAQAGDRLLLVIAYGGGGIPAVLGASGVSGGAGGQWPALPSFPVGGTAPGTALDIRTGVCRFSDIGATLTVFFNTATAKAIMWVEAWRDPNGTPEINQASGKLAATATALTTNSITPNVAGCWVMSVFTNRGLTGGTFLPGTDSGSGGALTERDDQTNSGSSQVAAELCDTNTTVTSGVATVHSSTSSATAAYCAGIVAIAPGSVFPTDRQFISSQLHPGRTPSSVARFRQTPRSTDIPAASATAITLSDGGTAADSFTVTVAAPLADSGTGTDSIAVSIPVALSDTGSASDSFTVAASVPLADTGAGTDTLAVSATVPLADAGSAADSLGVAIPIPLADVGAAADSLAVTAAVPLAEVGQATDQIAVAAAIPLADTGSASDSIVVQQIVPKPLSDTGAGTDSLTVTAVVPLADLGTAADSVAVAALVGLADTGSAADSFTVQGVGPGAPTPGTLTATDVPLATVAARDASASPTASDGAAGGTSTSATATLTAVGATTGGPS